MINPENFRTEFRDEKQKSITIYVRAFKTTLFRVNRIIEFSNQKPTNCFSVIFGQSEKITDQNLENDSRQFLGFIGSKQFWNFFATKTQFFSKQKSEKTKSPEQ